MNMKEKEGKSVLSLPFLFPVLTAIVLLILIYPDVIFLGASFRPSDLFDEFTHINSTPTSWFPDPAYRSPRDGYIDLPAALLQHEPAIHYMRRVIQNGESPFWNPYTAAGTVGVETMVDTKTSPVTLLAATLGANNFAFHFAWLFFCFLALYCLLKIGTVYLNLSPCAACITAFAFLMNGFLTANLATSVTPPYLLSPILFYALLHLATVQRPQTTDMARTVLEHGKASLLVETFQMLRQRSPSFICAILAEALLMLTLFMPVLLLVMTSVHLLAFIWACQQQQTLRQRLATLAILSMAPLTAFLLIAPISLPVLENLMTHPLLNTYNHLAQDFHAYPPHALISLFTPKHLWESYNTSFKILFSGAARTLFLQGKTIPHTGLICAFLALLSCNDASPIRRPLRYTCLVLLLIGVGRSFNLFPFTLITRLPAYRIPRVVYWPALWMLPFCLLIGMGFDTLQNTVRFPKRYLTYFLVPPILLLLLASNTGLPSDRFIPIRFTLLAAIFGALFLATLLLYRYPGKKQWLCLAILLLCFFELTYYANHLRPKRIEIPTFPSPVLEFVHQHLNNTPQARVLQIGRNDLAPSWGSAFQIPQVGDHCSGVMPWYQHFFFQYFNETPGQTEGFLTMGHGSTPGPPRIHEHALDLLGVRYILVNKQRAPYTQFFQDSGYPVVFEDDANRNPQAQKIVFENIDALPRAYCVHALKTAPLDLNAPTYRNCAWSNDPQLLQIAAEKNIPIDLPTNIPPTPAVITDYKHAHLKLKVLLNRPGVLVLSDTWHRNWRATANGKPTYLARINDAFRGIALDPGSYTIEMYYRPRSLRLGNILCITTLILLLSLQIQRPIRTTIPAIWRGKKSWKKLFP